MFLFFVQQGTKSFSLIGRCESFFVGRNYYGHIIKYRSFFPCPDHADPSGIIRVRRLKESQGTTDSALLNVRREPGIAGFGTLAPEKAIAQGAVSVKRRIIMSGNCYGGKPHRKAMDERSPSGPGLLPKAWNKSESGAN